MSAGQGNVNCERMTVAGLQVAQPLLDLVENDILPGTDIASEQFWQQAAEIIADLTPINQRLLNKRDELQSKIDAWHQSHPAPFDPSVYQRFLNDIGYLEPAENWADATIDTTRVDIEISHQAGPQLVVPVKNARFALNAANARWGSLYDALYGTDAISVDNGAEKTAGYNPVRGEKVVQFGRQFLDNHLPLTGASHQDVAAYVVVNGAFKAVLNDGVETGLVDPAAWQGYCGDPAYPSAILFKHNNLHIEIAIDPESPIGQLDSAGVKDIILEAAITTIMDCEDSVAAVDADDKVEVYRNWLGLMRGDLVDTFIKGGNSMTRRLSADREYLNTQGEAFTLSGRSLMFVRNVGHLMRNPAILDANNEPVFEGIMDGLMTSLIALHDVKKVAAPRNSQEGSVYIVKPKMHGSEEVAFAVQLFERIEQALGLPENTLKMGIMDEERRTTINLPNCIQAAKSRVVFINTGFLDRTGDEIHTSMLAGPMVPKTRMKQEAWIQAYEQWNVVAGLSAELKGKAQIGKGMWPIPDQMANMLKAKVDHPKSGANTAWVPSPIAATLHALHYHQVSVDSVQNQLLETVAANAREALVGDILRVPLLQTPSALSVEEVQKELDNNAQGILGYVVRWVSMGVGCSKVPDINDVGLMEDRATLRISSQHMANWLHHGICSEVQVLETLERMAAVVDQQNASDPTYMPMGPNFHDNLAFQAAKDLVLLGKTQPSGYTEPLLHAYRQKAKYASTV